ncbi:hypothetical protein FBY30_1960 [Arthrobacter sp. SLBN-83]|nr:hypothetical protein FBY30_1960 [Arthrobacter sp. SLBN-83]
MWLPSGAGLPPAVERLDWEASLQTARSRIGGVKTYLLMADFISSVAFFPASSGDKRSKRTSEV